MRWRSVNNPCGLALENKSGEQAFCGDVPQSATMGNGSCRHAIKPTTPVWTACIAISHQPPPTVSAVPRVAR